MFFRIADLEQKPVEFEVEFQPGQVDFLDSSVAQSGPLSVQGRASYSAALEEIRIKGRMSGRFRFECDRCVEPFDQPVGGPFELRYQSADSLSGGPAEAEVSDSDVDAGTFEGDGLDLEDVVREQVLLALPMQRVCRSDCKGLCPVCGQNRNEGNCGCQVRSDDRWAALKKFSGE